ncbi:MAG: hypothetical protein ACK4R7_03225, partial [Fervidobacterium sp.]
MRYIWHMASNTFKILIFFLTLVEVTTFTWSFHSILNYYILRELSLNLNFIVEITQKNFKEERVYNNDEFIAEIME